VPAHRALRAARAAQEDKRWPGARQAHAKVSP